MKFDGAWPKIIKAGAVAVKIYRVRNVVHGREYHLFTVAYSLGGKRHLKQFADYDEAHAEAKKRVAEIAIGRVEANYVSTTDIEILAQAKRLLLPYRAPILQAVEEWVAARKLGVPLLTAAEFYVSKHSEKIIPIKVADAVEKFIAHKEQDGASVRYLADCRSRLRRFGQDFKVELTRVDTPTMETWLRSFGVSGRTRNNYRNLLVTFSRWARAQCYLPKGEETASESVQVAKERAGEIHIFTPDQLHLLLDCTPQKHIPYVVLGAFCGIRHAEICRLTWSDVNLKQKHVLVGADKAKTATNRLVPLPDNAVAWLTPFEGMTGQICSGWQSSKVRAIARGKKVKIGWPSNALRHSFISYRLAIINDVAKVALEAGNSPQMIFQNYRAIVTPQDAKHWFAIFPKRNQRKRIGNKKITTVYARMDEAQR